MKKSKIPDSYKVNASGNLKKGLNIADRKTEPERNKVTMLINNSDIGS